MGEVGGKKQEAAMSVIAEPKLVIFGTAGALVVITVYRVSTPSITQSTSLTFCSKTHRACIKQRYNLTIPNNIFRHTC